MKAAAHPGVNRDGALRHSGVETPSCCAAGTLIKPGLLGSLRDAVKAVGAAAAGLLGGREVPAAAISAESRLIISSPCAGSLERTASPCRQDDTWMGNPANSRSGPSWNGWCSVCKRPLTIAVAEEEPPKRPRKEAERYAYVITLWGASPEYVLGAMVLGWSLRSTGTRHDMVVVHTDDVSSSALDLLRRAGWKLHLVEHVSESAGLMDQFCKTMRFAKVFTKLRVLELVQYSKIALMDIDMVVRTNIDDLFELEAPVAMVRGPKVGYKHGEKVSGRNFFAGHREDGYSWGQSSGINAGLMLLRPDTAVFEHMMSEVTDPKHPEHIKGAGPEQDYLSRFYAGDWRQLSVAYNFQLHHMYFAISPVNYGEADRLAYLFDPSLIKVIHYSSEPKPWARKLEACYADWSDDKWAQEILNSFTGYTSWVCGDVDGMKREGDRHNLLLGPDGHLHAIDYKRCKSTWNGNGWNQEMRKDHEYKSNGETKEQIADAQKGGMVSEDGWPLGEAVKVDLEAAAAAEKVLRMTQDIWFAAYEDLAADLGESDLAGVVTAATTGPVIRQPHTWPTQQKSTGWSNSGWWVEGAIAGRFVATCSTLPEGGSPQVHASLSVGNTVLFTATSEGVHVAAVDAAGVAHPAPQSFLGPDSVTAATTWASSVEDGAVVMLAAIDTTGDGGVGATLEALAQAGLGCPSTMPALPCTVAATVGQKGKGTWYATHAAAHLAHASHNPLPEKT